jgi:hypothetical protein
MLLLTAKLAIYAKYSGGTPTFKNDQYQQFRDGGGCEETGAAAWKSEQMESPGRSWKRGLGDVGCSTVEIISDSARDPMMDIPRAVHRR